MSNMTIIVPLVEYKEEHNFFIERMWKSILSTEVKNVIFVGPTSTINYIKTMVEDETIDVLYLENNKNTELQFQINKAVKDVKTEYFSILEFDDAYTDFWFKNVQHHIKHQPDTGLFIPLVEVLDYEHLDMGAIAYANEPVWASFFSDEIGTIDNASLQNFFNFVVSGGVFKKSDFLYTGGLKNNIKVFFWYEYLLRMTHNGKKVYVIPKVGCEHIVNRTDSLTSEFGAMDQDELDFWFEAAKEEYRYKADRKKVFTRES